MEGIPLLTVEEICLFSAKGRTYIFDSNDGTLNTKRLIERRGIRVYHVYRFEEHFRLLIGLH